jgi:hypothetical protein
MKKIIFCMVILVALFVVSATSAQNEVYLVPKYSNASFCNTTEVQIWANTTNTFGGGTINLTYTFGCANVTNWVYGPLWVGLSLWDSNVDGREYLTFLRLTTVNGSVLIGNLTIHCHNNSGCATQLTFSPPSKLTDPVGGDLTVSWENGTFRCGVLSSCLGTCCNDSACNETYQPNMACAACIALNKYWKPNQDSACFAEYTPSELCLNYCPQCCNGIDDDDEDTDVDFPSDLDCTCGLDPSEAYPAAPIPELPTIVLFSAGLLMLTGYVLWKKRS